MSKAERVIALAAFLAKKKPGPAGKNAPAPTDAQVTAAIHGWLEQNRHTIKGRDAEPIRPETVAMVAAEWLEKNITQPKDAPAPTDAQIRDAAHQWLETNRASLKGADAQPPTVEQIAAVATEWLRENIRQPQDGRTPTAEELAAVAASWLSANIKQPKNGKSIKGDQGPIGPMATPASRLASTSTCRGRQAKQ
jgi:hypothetical protein